MTQPKPELEDVFNQALAQPSDTARAEYLAQLGADFPDLRERAEALLRAHVAAGGFLGGAPAVTAAPVPSSASDQPTQDIRSHDRRDLNHQHAGDVIGPYKLLQRIGEGGMGEVWVAKQTSPIVRQVALKLVKAGLDSKSVNARFEQERQALALMDHPHIAKVLDGGLTPERRPYFVMELVNGLPLNRFCDESRLGIRERLELFVPVCQAVQHAHQKGIIHRDLKPTNILVTMIDGKPVPKVIDFGVAKAVSGRLTDKTLATEFGAVVGTLEYMSPEQAGYSGVDVDTRSDIYSLGVVLYELLTGLRPLDATRLRNAALAEMMRILREEEPEKPSTRLSTDDSLPSLAATRQTDPKRLMTLLRGELDWVVMKCLEKQRDQRYESASALGRDIGRYLRNEPVEARPASVVYRVRKYFRRHQASVLLLSSLAVAFVALLGNVVVGRMYARSERERKEVAAARKLADEMSERAMSNERQALAAAEDARVTKEQVRQVLYAADLRVAWNLWEQNQPQKMRELLQRHATPTDQRDYRGFEWYYLWRLANGYQRSLHGHEQPIHALAFAGSAGALLSGDMEYQYRRPGVIQSWRLLGRSDKPATLFTQRVAPDRDGYFPGIRSLVASPDGSRCALVDGGVVRVLDARSGEEQLVLQESDLSLRSVAFAPDGKQLATGSYAGTLAFWDAQTGQKTASFGKHEWPILCLTYSPDGTFLAAGGGDPSAPTWSQLLHGELRLWKVADQQLAAECTAVRSLLHDVSFDVHSKHVAAATLEGTVVVWNVDRPDGVRILRGHSGAVTAVKWLPDGRFLASAGDDGLVRVWDIGREQGDHVYKGHTGPVTALAVSADGNLLASAGRDAMIRLWDPHIDPLRTQITDFSWAIGTLRFSADGRWLAIGDYKQITLCETERFAKRRTWSIDHWCFAMDLSPDGQWVATAGNQGPDGQEPGIIKIWDVASGKAHHTLTPAMQSVQQVVFSADGRRVAFRGRTSSREQREFALEVWDIQSEKPCLQRVDAVAFDLSPNGRAVALAGHRGARLVSIDSPDAAEVVISSQPCRAIRYSPTGRQVAWLEDDGQLALWSADEQGGGPLGRATHGITFSRDGRWIAAAQDASVEVWDAVQMRHASSIPQNAAHLDFVGDGQTIVTARDDIQLWQTETGRELLHLGTYTTGGVNTLAVSPDGTRLAVGGGYRDEHQGVWVWQGPVGNVADK